MEKTFLLLGLVLVGLNLRNVLAQLSGPKCELTKAWFGTPSGRKTLPGFCTNSREHALKGDFNGDGRMDIMCHDSRYGRKWIYYGADNGYSNVGWQRSMSWCYHRGASLYIGDFNGDGRDDMLCHDTAGNVYVSYADKDGHFSSTYWHKPMGFCACRRCHLFIGDFNGDGRSDMLCHDGAAGRKWIAYGTVSGNFQNAYIWHKYMMWCFDWGGKLYVGDFNGDHRDDMYCYDDVNVKGNMFTAYARYDGSFLHTDNINNMGWCFASGCTLSVARVSKDQRDDLVCHCRSPSQEPLRVRFPARDDGFETYRQWRRTEKWCRRSTDMLLVGPLKPGHCGALVCIDKSTGQYSIAFS